MPKEKGKSFVWEHFLRTGPEEKVKKCKRCSYIDPSTSSSTSNMASHLLHKHGISNSKEEKEGNTVPLGNFHMQQSTITTGPRRSIEEWTTRQVVEDGLSFRQISGSEFQAAACVALKLKHFKSHTTVGKVVMNYIEDMKVDTKLKLSKKFAQGERFSVIADEWTSLRNRRYLNVTVINSSYSSNLGLARCKGSMTGKAVAEMVKVILFIFCLLKASSMLSGRNLYYKIKVESSVGKNSEALFMLNALQKLLV